MRPLKIDYVEADYLPYANPDINVLQLNPRALLNHLAAASHTLPFPDTCTRMRATLNLLAAEHGIQGENWAEGGAMEEASGTHLAAFEEPKRISLPTLSFLFQFKSRCRSWGT